MEKDTFKLIEGTFYSYKALQAELANLKINLEELEEINVLSVSGDGGKGSTPTYAINSVVENELLRRDKLHQSAEYKALQSEIRAIERKIAKIDNMVNSLDDKEQLLIRKRYIEHKPVEAVVDLLGYTSRQSYDSMRRKIIIKLIPLYTKSFNIAV